MSPDKSPHWSTLCCEAIRNGVVVGSATLTLISRPNGLTGLLDDVWVSPEHRRKGIATALVQEAVQLAKSQGCYKVTLACDWELVGLYERCGFYVNGTAMRLDLWNDAPE